MPSPRNSLSSLEARDCSTERVALARDLAVSRVTVSVTNLELDALSGASALDVLTVKMVTLIIMS